MVRWGHGRRLWAGLLVLATALFGGVGAAQATLALTPQQSAWIAQQQGKVFSVGFDPYAGMDSFVLQGKRQGLLHLLLQDMAQETGLRLVPADSKDWDAAYQRFVGGKSDILYGANPTPEREAIMRFTAPVVRYPYVTLARKASSVQTLADIHAKRVGFIENDFVQQALPQAYPNLHFESVTYSDQLVALQALEAGRIDAFVTSGGGVEVEYLVAHPQLAVVAQLRAITSDMTLAVALDQTELQGILQAYISQRQDAIARLARQARQIYNRKALQLSPAELDWLEHVGTAVVGAAEDYLPFDYQSKGQYKGIAGETLQAIADTVGLKLTVVSAPFAKIMDAARAGQVHVVNMAKTEDRLKDFIFPHPFSTERDIVIGRKTSPPVSDIYALDGQRVAVIEGFWHEEYLRKNLRQPHIVTTADILESLRKVRDGEADYLIENPTVVEYYINGLGYQDLAKRGETSGDSALYFGVSRTQPELAGIMDKVIPLLSFEELKYRGLQTVPAVENEANRRLLWLAALLTLALAAIVTLTAVMARKLTNERLSNQFLREREQLLYTDVLTGFFNRNHYSAHIAALEQSMALPAAVVVADLNNLKRANDAYGHAVGDELLRLFAQQMRTQWPQATGYRMGGDEFLMVLEGADPQAVQGQIDALLARCAQTPLVLDGGVTLRPSAAIGFSIRTERDSTMDQCVARADQHMYEAKVRQKKRSTDHMAT
ncbi:MAG: transporter substrate-binding domain-containing protein [Rhodoferax sp.]|nr:MAG: transporter substrate-binding domain-containing protein [Rhodoferax sp.]